MCMCKECIHNSMCGCMMLDCIHHPDNEKYSVSMQTNTFRDRFADRKAGAWVDTGGKRTKKTDII